jgi:hypothetical protein
LSLLVMMESETRLPPSTEFQRPRAEKFMTFPSGLLRFLFDKNKVMR